MNWFIDNLQYIVLGVLSLANTIVLLCKKKFKLVDSIYCAVLEKLPSLIIEAENTGLSGSAKYSYVVQQAIIYISNATGYSIKQVTELYGSDLDTAIESILSTPQKKGDNVDEETK